MNLTPPTPNQQRIFWFALTALAVAMVIAVGAGFIWGLGQLLDLMSPVLWPLAVAGVVACLLSPLVDWLESRRLPRTRAIILVFVVVFAVVGGVLASVIPQVVLETQQLAKKIPDYSAQLQVRAANFMAHPPDLLRRFLPASDNPDTTPAAGLDYQTLAPATDWLKNSLPKLGSWLVHQTGRVASGFGILVGLALIPVYAFYFLLEKRSMQLHWKEYLPLRNDAARAELSFVLDAISRYLVAFFRGQVLVALCDAVMYTIGFSLVGLNYAFLLGFAAVILTMIPFLGAIVILLTALLLAFVQFGDGLHPLLVLVVFGVVQSLEGLVISPKIMGDRVGLHPLTIIIAVLVGTTLLGGILGGILAIPLTAALRTLMFRYVWKRREPQGH